MTEPRITDAWLERAEAQMVSGDLSGMFVNRDDVLALVRECRRLLAAALPSHETTPAGVLDEAWAGAEKAIRDGVVRAITIAQYPSEYERAGQWTAFLVHERQYYGNGPTPAAALHALAAALGRSGSGGGRG